MKSIYAFIMEGMSQRYEGIVKNKILREYAELQKSILEINIDYDADSYHGEIKNSTFEFEVEPTGNGVTNLTLTNSAYTKDGYFMVNIGECDNNKSPIIKRIYDFIKNTTPNAQSWTYSDF